MEVVALVVAALGPAAALWWGRPSMMARRGRNAWVGMRTRHTMESEHAWRAGHAAAWPAMWISSAAALVVQAGAVVLLTSSGPPPGWLLPLAVIGGTLAWSLGMVGAAVVADRTAREVSEPGSP